jgi:hypothetical protein
LALWVEKLAVQDSTAAALVKLLYFAGVTVKEAAQMLGFGPVGQQCLTA